jgi:hypothetical protein
LCQTFFIELDRQMKRQVATGYQCVGPRKTRLYVQANFSYYILKSEFSSA